MRHSAAPLTPPHHATALWQDAALLLALYDDGKEIKRNAVSLIRAQQSLDLAALVIWVLIVGFTWALRAIQPQGALNLKNPFHVFFVVTSFATNCFATVYAFARFATRGW